MDELLLMHLDDARHRQTGYRAFMMNGLSDPPPCAPDVMPPYLLIGNELALYREVLAGVLQAMRPAIPVRVVPAADLDATVACQCPSLVICSAVSAVVDASVPAWILLHPNENQDTIVSVRGERRTIPHPTVDELVQLVDEVWNVA